MSTGPPTRRQLRGDAGFTLLEMLVTLGLLALITALLVGSLDSTRKALAFVERFNAANNIAAAQNYLRSTLIEARLIQLGGTAEAGEPGFAGGATDMAFISSHVPRAQFDGLYRIEIGLEPSPVHRSAFDLVVIQTLLRPATQDAQAVPPPRLKSKLIENVAGIAFAYFGAADEASSPQWQDAWSYASRLPGLVSIDVKFARGDDRSWHRLNVALYASDASFAPCPPRVSCR